MSIVTNSILLLLLGIVFLQDMKYRAVSWFLFPAIAVLFIVNNIMQVSIKEQLLNTCINLVMLTVIFLFITLYFTVKAKSLINIIQELIGWGDILFFVCLAVLFSPMNFMLFIVASLLFIAIGTGIYIAINKEQQIPIPLAGLQALFLILLLVANTIYPIATFNSDEWLLQLALMP